MTYDNAEYTRLRTIVISVSLLSWVVIWFRPNSSSCCVAIGSAMPLGMLCKLNPVSSRMGDWALMLSAMMGPTLVPAIYHIRICSFARRRARAIALFIAGYGTVWMVAGAILLIVAREATGRLQSQLNLPPIIAGVVALVWQASPFKQRCLNRCHSHKALTAFGIRADCDVTRMGFEHGFWCVGSCWVAMLFPILLAQGHFLAMALVSVLMFC